jgi:hypothetical protein
MNLPTLERQHGCFEKDLVTQQETRRVGLACSWAPSLPVVGGGIVACPVMGAVTASVYKTFSSLPLVLSILTTFSFQPFVDFLFVHDLSSLYRLHGEALHCLSLGLLSVSLHSLSFHSCLRSISSASHHHLFIQLDFELIRTTATLKLIMPGKKANAKARKLSAPPKKIRFNREIPSIDRGQLSTIPLRI